MTEPNHERATRNISPEEAISFAKAGLALAGHEITDPYLIELQWKQARGEITGDEARRLGIAHIQGL